ncbi:MerR family transcriptional regulator [Paenibacillus sp. FSL H8-0034]|uniref:MerR family transcriptional regulator n=1 Tax=Paenibacillus sp. FSL H8-0034 TaxID=2954671 RepID=UPI0030F768BD
MSDEELYYSTQQTTELTGLSKDTLRYYEKIGILQRIGRDTNNYRMYSKEDVDWLILVKYLRGIGIGTTEFIGAQSTSLRKRREYLKNYQIKVEKEIEELQRIKEIVSGKIKFLKTRENEDL